LKIWPRLSVVCVQENRADDFPLKFFPFVHAFTWSRN
jgi:hypothetical protein